MTSTLRSIRRHRLLAVCTAAAMNGAGLLAVLATPAQAATTVGQTGAISGGCSPDNIGNVQNQTGAPPSYTVPFDGVITSFSAVFDTGGKHLKLLILQPVSGTTYNVVAKSDLATFTAAGLQTSATRIPVRASQLIGNYGQICGLAAANPGDLFHYFSGPEPATGASQDFPNVPGVAARLNLSASLEADADNDGFGDETQDQCPTDASTQGACPAPSGAAPAAPTCKGKKATIVGTNGNDVRRGTSGKDVIAGLGGNDKLSGLAGNDVICGGAGKDILKGGKGNDKLFGQKGKDTLKGGPGKDKLKGGAGKDKQVQ